MIDVCFFGELKKLKKLEKLSAEPTAYQKTNVLVDHIVCKLRRLIEGELLEGD